MEDLHVAPVMTWWNNQNQWTTQSPPARLLVQFDRDRFYHLMAGEDEREGGALLYFNLPRPLPLAGRNQHPTWWTTRPFGDVAPQTSTAGHIALRPNQARGLCFEFARIKRRLDEFVDDKRHIL